MRMHPRERRYAELVKGSVPLAGRQNAYGDMQPDAENCSNGIAPQPNTATDSRKMTVPVVVSMTKFLFDHYRLSMYRQSSRARAHSGQHNRDQHE